MITKYLIIGYRNLKNRFVLNSINILGLALGLASCTIIVLFVHRELTYDQQFSGSDRIFRIATSFFNIGTFANGPAQLREHALDFPATESATRIKNINDVPVGTSEVQGIESRIYLVDSSFFTIFDFKFLQGDPRSCMRDPQSIVIGEAVAKKYFGSTASLGKTILVGKEKAPKTVTGVLRDTNEPTHLAAQVFMPYDLAGGNNTNWNSASVYTYVKIRDNFHQADLETSIAQLIREQVYPSYGSTIPYETWIKQDNAYKLIVQPLTRIYLDSKLRNELSPGGNINNVRIFSAVVMLTLFLAFVNFVNLSVAQASRRVKEVSIKKSMGVQRSSLIIQFLTESMLTSIVALFCSLMLAELFLSLYHGITGQILLSSIFAEPQVLGLFVLFALLCGLLSGLYPAFFLTEFNVVNALKGIDTTKRKSAIKNGLIVVQFSISTILIVFMLIIVKQVRFLQNKDVGFDGDNIMVIQNASALSNEKNFYFNKLTSHSAVAKACLTWNPPVGSSFWIYTYQMKSMPEAVTYNTMPTDENFIETFGVRLIQGRNFNALDTDSTAAILNESAVKDLMLEDPIGAEINPGLKVVGVVSDFHFKGLQVAIEPLVLRLRKDGYNMAFKLKGNAKDFISTAEAEWKKLSPEEPMKYYFVDDNFIKLMEKERTFSVIMILFSLLAIFISCIGLFGISLFTAEQRQKEISIRRVVGASVSSILVLMNSSFIRLVLLAYILSVPVIIYIGSSWLATFPYRTDIGWFIFTSVLFGIVAIAATTVIFSSLATARRNPVETLRSE